MDKSSTTKELDTWHFFNKLNVSKWQKIKKVSSFMLVLFLNAVGGIISSMITLEPFQNISLLMYCRAENIQVLNGRFVSYKTPVGQ